MLDHGTCEISLENNIAVVRLKGSFNESGIIPCIEKATSEISKYGKNPFYMLLDLREYVGSTPEAYELQDKYNAWLNSLNLVAKAILVANSYIVEVSRKQEKSLEEQKKIVKEFANEEEAREWLNSKMK